MISKEERVGRRYGLLTVTGFYTKGSGHKSRTVFRCLCDCGEACDQEGGNLEKVKSCGCVRQARSDNAVVYMPEYAVWEQMIQRCCNEDCPTYVNYGARGIRVFFGWLAKPGERKAEGFRAFLAHVGPRPEGDRRWLIERIDNNGNYEPGNVRWALDLEQARNKRTNRWIEYDGRQWTITDLAKANNISPPQLHKRLADGMSVHEAVTTPTKMVGRKVWASKLGNVAQPRK